MEDIVQNQYELSNGIKAVGVNFKKDGPDRKSSESIKRRLDTLETYWQEFQQNHQNLVDQGNFNHEYFNNKQYQKTLELYNLSKSILMSYEQTKFSVPKPSASQDSTLKTSLTQKQAPTEKMNTSDAESQVKVKPTEVETPSQVQITPPLEATFAENLTTSKKSQGNSSLTDELLRKQASNFKAFARTISNINLDEVSEKWELDDLLKSVLSRWSTIDSTHWELDSLLSGCNEIYEQTFNHHEIIFNKIKKEINSKLWSMVHREKSTPQMEIPSFSGGYQQWVSFKDLFTEAIHGNANLSNAQKMQFLKSKVKGEAERLIQHLPISSENYMASWEILNNRFNNKKAIFSHHMNDMLNIPVIQQPSVSSIKRLHDTILECLNAVKNLGVDISTWDPLLVHIMCQKLDGDTHNEYSQSIKQRKELPILQEFLDFLENKFTNLESSKNKKQDSQSSQKNNAPNFKHYQKPYQHKQAYSSNRLTSQSYKYKNVQTNKYVCPLCNKDHGLYFCEQFLDMTPVLKRKTIAKLNVCQNCLFGHNGKACTSEKRCRKCDGCHNTILHEAYGNMTPTNIATSRAEVRASERAGPSNNTHVTQQTDDMTEILLATAMLKVQARDGSWKCMRALIDQGSQVSIISENAAQQLSLPRQACKGSIFGIGAKANSCKGAIELTCSSLNETYNFTTTAFIMQNLIKQLPNQTLQKPTWAFLNNIQLADPDFHLSRPVDILLGADVYSNILLSGICREENQSTPIAQQTKLGWILCGSAKTYQCNLVLNNIEEIERFWQTEDISQESSLSQQDEDCIKFYQKTTERLSDGRYQVRLPMKPKFEDNLGESKNKAVAQFKQLERKFNKNITIANGYKAFIDEYLLLGHMKPADTREKIEYYLPHHCVQRAESTTTSLRVVFNASSITSSGQSLNDVMYAGPNLQQDLQSLLLQWRQFEVAFTADIEKMFRQIWIHPEDQKYLKIVWRDGPSIPIQDYQLTTVTYGTKAAPFLAMMTLKQLANNERSNYTDSQAIKCLEECFYMDDLLYGSHSVQSAIKLKRDLIKLLKSGGFNLRKWNSNKTELLEQRNKIESQDNNFEFKQANSTKTLGLRWESNQDVFTFQSKVEQSTKPSTKRSLLSDISKQFDPLGWISPITTQQKILFQKVWQTNINWDDKLPEDIEAEWNKIKIDIKNIDRIQIPRWLNTKKDSRVDLHGFCDSSEKAYGCVIYCRTITENQSSVVLLVSKTRLVPTNKKITIPRLELCGAHLLSNLMKKVQTCLNEFELEIYGWCDSTAVLGWINGEPEKWKPFVANRVKKITDVMPPQCWKFVKSEENPADCASRGLTATQLIQHHLWWQGPSWLATYKKEVGKSQTYETNEEKKEQKQSCVVTKQESDSIIEEILHRQGSLTRVVRIVAWLLRFTTKKTADRQSYLSLTELREAKNKVIRHVQRCEFDNEIKCITSKKPISAKSKIQNLNPFLDKNGLLRADGRLENANISNNMKHPIILPNKNRLTELIISHAHNVTMHGGARLTSAFIRQHYWVIGGNKAVKRFIRQCIKCRRHSPSIQNQIMGDLPEARTNPARPFHHTGVDYTGYFDIKANKGRGIKTTKGYIAVFVCMASKAVHLELVSELTASAFLAALRRMTARRGAPRHIYCDNGTNFVGASRILEQEILQHLQDPTNQDIMAEITEMGVEFHFNAPSWPSAGGLWEAAVKSVKHHIKRVIGEQKLTYEEYSTVLAQLEACLNSRPLCALTEDIQDINFLTPAHFLTGTADVTIIQTEHDARTRWQLTEKIVKDTWRRWTNEYLTQLNVRNKWKTAKTNIEIGNLVTVKDDNLPPGKWLMGRVTELHPGKDGFVRVVSLKTKNGIIKRPVNKLAVLPLKEETKQPETRKPTKPATSLLSLALQMVLFMCLVLPAQGTVNIKQLYSNQSLYFDPITNIKVIRDDWKLITYYNMEPYWEGYQALDKYLDHMSKLCFKINGDAHCTALIMQLRHSYDELKYYDHMMLGKQTDAKRRRRGLVNGVGYLANSLFGVLDDHFAEKYEHDITLVRENHKHLALLLQNQTSIIEAEHNMIKRTENIMYMQHKTINKHLGKLDNAVEQARSEIEQIAIVNDFTSSAIIGNNLIMNLNGIQGMLIDIITDLYHGKFNVHLINPEQLQSELNKISGHLNKDLSLPIDNIQADLSKMYQFLRIKARLTGKYLIFEIRIPLLSRDTYEMYKALPIPQINGNKTINIIPVGEYIAINLGKDTYIPMTENDLQDCNQFDTSIHLCHLKKPIYHRKSDEDLCVKNKQTDQCETSISACKSKWTELNKINTYLFLCCEVCAIRILCEDQITAQYLRHAGVIALGHGCIIKTEQFTIYTHKEFSSELKINAEIPVPDISPINHLINISIPTTEKILDNFAELNKSMMNIDKRISDIKQQNTVVEGITNHDIHHYATIYVLLTIMVIGAAWYTWHRIRKRRAPAAGAGAVPQQPAHTHTASTRHHRRAQRRDRASSPVTFRNPAFSIEEEVQV